MKEYCRHSWGGGGGGGVQGLSPQLPDLQLDEHPAEPLVIGSLLKVLNTIVLHDFCLTATS